LASPITANIAMNTQNESARPAAATAAAQQQAADQIEPRSEAVDKKADRCLHDRGHHAESRGVRGV